MKYQVKYKKKNRFEFAEIGDTKLNGFIEKYMNRFFQNRIFSDFAKSEIYQEAEDALKYPRDDQTVVGHWSGEFWGKLMLSACRVCRYTKDYELKKWIEKVALRVCLFAREDGYLNSYRDSMNVFSPDPVQAFAVMGWNCDWNWNIWCRKYTLWGLIECAELTDNQTILKAAYKLAMQLMNELEKNRIPLWETGTKNFCGLPSSSLLKPLLILYRLVGDEKLLKYCIQIAEHWDNNKDQKPNIIRNALLKKPIHTWYPDSHLWAKAYEMMSCLDGLLELYRVTGTEKYLDAVICMHDLLQENESNVMGSVGFNDIFAHASVIENALSEPCDVIHWMRMCTELFALTGNVKYANAAEKAFYNAFLASVSDDGTWGARAVRSNCKNMIAEGQSGTKYNQCCMDNIPRGYINITQFALMQGRDGLYVNLFCPLTGVVDMNGSEIKIEISDGYLQQGILNITVQNRQQFNMYLRIPEMIGEHASVNGIALSSTSNGYYKIVVQPGESNISLDFNFKAQIHDFPFEVPDYEKDDFHILRWTPYGTKGRALSCDFMEKKRCSFITYGPLLLAKSKKTGWNETEMFSFETICGTCFEVEAVYQKSEDPSVLACYAVTLHSGGYFRKLDMCAYATADDYSSDDDRYFTIYV